MQKINFENLPSTTTPLNATNMNAIQTNVEDVFNGEEPMGDIRVGGIEGKNLFNKENYSQTGYLNNDGSRSSNSAWIITEYISVTPGEKITISGTTYPGQNPSICYYDANRTFLSGEKHNSVENRTITAPSNCYYIRESINITYDLDTAQIERSSSATTYSKYQGIGYVSGNNENGSYMKFDDGTLIQYGYIELGNMVFDTAVGGMYRNANNLNIKQQYYPLNFIDTNNVVIANAEGNSYLLVSSNSTRRYRDRFTTYLLSPVNTTINNVIILWQAIGRWK